LLDLATSVGDFNNIQLFEKETSYIPHFVVQSEYCKIYTCSFEADAPTDFLSSDVTNAEINLYPSIFMDSNLFSNPNYKADATTTNNFMKELAASKVDTMFAYSNVVNVNNNNSGMFQDCTNIYINSQIGSYYTNDSIYVESLRENDNEAINDIFDIITEKQFTIKKINYDFSYFIGSSTTPLKFQHEENIEKLVTDEFKVSSPFKTMFDGNTVREDPNGVEGFMIPVDSNGQYTVTITYVDMKNNVRKICINSSFQFSKQQDIYDDIAKKDVDLEVDDTYENDKYYD
jgi:hypothetical protein